MNEFARGHKFMKMLAVLFNIFVSFEELPKLIKCREVMILHD